MQLPRRRFLGLTGAGAAFAAMLKTARAQSYPARPIHLIVGFPAGGPNDILGRFMAQWLSGRLSQP
ncbi:MAG: tripartite tricarboxylate transporter substrate binding protein, partial [Methylocella sp.]